MSFACGAVCVSQRDALRFRAHPNRDPRFAPNGGIEHAMTSGRAVKHENIFIAKLCDSESARRVLRAFA
jgi:hypothetical protein